MLADIRPMQQAVNTNSFQFQPLPNTGQQK
jgi:hypothetical protein